MGAGRNEPSDGWKVIPFVDNRPQSEHHTYRISPQRGPYGSMFIDDARKAAAACDLLDVALATRTLVAEAAMTGFNCQDGDWAERLYANQARLSAAIAKATKDS